MIKKKLGQVCDVLNGFAFKSNSYVQNGIRIIRIANVQKGYIDDSQPVFYPMNTAGLERYMLEEGDLLLSLTGNVGRVAVLQNNLLPAALNQRVACLRVKDGQVKLKYLFHILNSSKFEADCVMASNGVAQKNMSTEWLKEYEIFVYEPKEQENIVSQLDRVLDLISKRKQQIQKLDDLVKSQFIEMFGDVVKNNKRWVTFPMSSVAPIKAYKGKVEAIDGKVWLLNLDMVEAQTGDVQEEVLVDADEIGASTVAFNRDNILYSKLRPYLNKVVNPKKSGYATSELLPLRPNMNLLNKSFFATLLRSDAFVSFIQERVAGAKMPRVSIDVFKKFDVTCPPIELQNEFARFVEQTDKSKNVYELGVAA